MFTDGGMYVQGEVGALGKLAQNGGWVLLNLVGNKCHASHAGFCLSRESVTIAYSTKSAVVLACIAQIGRIGGKNVVTKELGKKRSTSDGITLRGYRSCCASLPPRDRRRVERRRQGGHR